MTAIAHTTTLTQHHHDDTNNQRTRVILAFASCKTPPTHEAPADAKEVKIDDLPNFAGKTWDDTEENPDANEEAPAISPPLQHKRGALTSSKD